MENTEEKIQTGFGFLKNREAEKGEKLAFTCVQI